MAAMVRSLVLRPCNPARYFEGSSWKRPLLGGGYEVLADDARLLDARSLIDTAKDADGHWPDGAATYRPRVSKDVPANTFWSVDLDDRQTRPLLETDDPYPSGEIARA
jgi:hypothetical protein